MHSCAVQERRLWFDKCDSYIENKTENKTTKVNEMCLYVLILSRSSVEKQLDSLNAGDLETGLP